MMARAKIVFDKNSTAANIFTGGNKKWDGLADLIVASYNNVSGNGKPCFDRRLLNCTHQFSESYCLNNGNKYNCEDYIVTYWKTWVECDGLCPSNDPLFGVVQGNEEIGRAHV